MPAGAQLFGCFNPPGTTRAELTWVQRRSQVSSFQLITNATTPTERIDYGPRIQALSAAGLDDGDITALLQVLPDARRANPAQRVINGEWGQYYISYNPLSDSYTISGHRGSWPDHTIGPQKSFRAHLHAAIAAAEDSGFHCTTNAKIKIESCQTNPAHILTLWPQPYLHQPKVAEFKFTSKTPIADDTAGRRSVSTVLSRLLGKDQKAINQLFTEPGKKTYQVIALRGYIIITTKHSWRIILLNYFG